MTLKELYEAVLIEVNKDEAPNITLDDFNYMANKAVLLYINKRYNIYDTSLQTTDDLRVLKSSAILPATHTPYKNKIQNNIENIDSSILDFVKNMSFMDATYTVELPDDYVHILNCECLYAVKYTHKCNNKNNVARAKATRLTADTWNEVVDNFWNKPEYYRPYYYIHNVNTSLNVPTNPNTYKNTEVLHKAGELFGTDNENTNRSTDVSTESDVFKDIDIQGFLKADDVIVPHKKAQVRYGNASKVLMEIRYGLDNTVYDLKAVIIDYIKAPQHLRLTQELLDKTLDISQTLEFPDYVCQEIVNELVHIVQENIGDPRLQTHPVVSQSIALPTQQLTSEPAGLSAK